MRHFIIPAALSLIALIPLPAAAQDQTADQQMIDEADKAAEAMAGTVYVIVPATPKLPSEIIKKVQELGYTNIEDFDVEYGMYELEATTPGGDEVELDIDPITGAIVDIDEDFL